MMSNQFKAWWKRNDTILPFLIVVVAFGLFIGFVGLLLIIGWRPGPIASTGLLLLLAGALTFAIFRWGISRNVIAHRDAHIHELKQRLATAERARTESNNWARTQEAATRRLVNLVISYAKHAGVVPHDAKPADINVENLPPQMAGAIALLRQERDKVSADFQAQIGFTELAFRKSDERESAIANAVIFAGGNVGDFIEPEGQNFAYDAALEWLTKRGDIMVVHLGDFLNSCIKGREESERGSQSMPQTWRTVLGQRMRAEGYVLVKLNELQEATFARRNVPLNELRSEKSSAVPLLGVQFETPNSIL